VSAAAAVAVSSYVAITRRTEKIQEQATRVAVWSAGSDARVNEANRDDLVIGNQSNAPISQVILEVDIAWTWHDDAPAIYDVIAKVPKTYIVQVPPGDWLVRGPHSPASAMDVRPGVKLSFLDGAGRMWSRDARGQLKRRRRGWRIWRHRIRPFDSKPIDEKPATGPGSLL
jgi:hypothetical protein